MECFTIITETLGAVMFVEMLPLWHGFMFCRNFQHDIDIYASTYGQCSSCDEGKTTHECTDNEGV